MVVSGESIDESSQEVGSSCGVQVSKAVLLDTSKSHDWESELSNSGDVSGDLVVVLGCVVGVDFASFCLDFVHVCDDVLVGSGVYLHLTLGLPVLEPVCGGVKVSLGVWAIFCESFELRHVSKDFLDSLEDHLVILGREIVGNIADIGLESLVILEACL